MGIGERLGKTVLNALHKGSAQAQVRSQSQMERSLESLATFRLAGMLQTTPGIDIQYCIELHCRNGAAGSELSTALAVYLAGLSV